MHPSCWPQALIKHEAGSIPYSLYWQIYLAKHPGKTLLLWVSFSPHMQFLSYNLGNWCVFPFGFIVTARKWAKAWRIILTQISSLTNTHRCKVSNIIFWWPDAIFTSSIRMFLIDSPIICGDNLHFCEEGVHKVISHVLLLWLNSFQFFMGHLALL